ncbi:MAG: hypothetical protein WBA93_01340 [Microcoleaceae cyanobacterium]
MAIKIYQQWGIDVSKETIKRIIKKLNMLWKRVKTGLNKTLNAGEIEVNTSKLLELK